MNSVIVLALHMALSQTDSQTTHQTLPNTQMSPAQAIALLLTESKNKTFEVKHYQKKVAKQQTKTQMSHNKNKNSARVQQPRSHGSRRG